MCYCSRSPDSRWCSMSMSVPRFQFPILTTNMNEKELNVLLSHVVIGWIWYNNQLRMAYTTVKCPLWMENSNKNQMNNSNLSSPNQTFRLLKIEATLRCSANWNSVLFEVISLRQHHHYFAFSLSFYLLLFFFCRLNSQYEQ